MARNKRKKKISKRPLIYLLTILCGIGFYLHNSKAGIDKEEEVYPNSINEASIQTPTSTYNPEEDERFYDLDSYLLAANKKHKLPEDYEPTDLALPQIELRCSQCYLRQEAASQLEELYNDALKEGIRISLISGYRSYDYQVALYNSYVSNYGQEMTDTFSARPGYSDHQTGLAMDLGGVDTRYDLTQDFELTNEGAWLHEHAHEYGFIMRFPKGKEDITGYNYEPWHFRYIGKEEAMALMEEDEWNTFEEYYGIEGGYYED